MTDIPQQEWPIVLHPDFDPEFNALPLEVQDGLLAVLRLLGDYGPRLGRPHVDTLAGFAVREYEGIARTTST